MGNAWQRWLAYFRLSLHSELQFRFNIFSETVLQPIFICATEFALWNTVLRSTQGGSLAGHSREAYLSYALWATFLGRMQMTWTTEYSMIREIERGDVNVQLLRPGSYFEAKFFQHLGVQSFFVIVSLVLAYGLTRYYQLPFRHDALPLALLSAGLYFLFAFTVGFAFATLAFRLTKVTGFVAAKNIALWMFTGELYPLDLFPEGWRFWMTSSPFAAAIYTPVGLLTGRLTSEQAWPSLMSLSGGLIIVFFVARLLWHRSLQFYSGTGA